MSWKKTRTAFATSISGCRMLALTSVTRALPVVDGRVNRAAAQVELLGNGVKAAVAERIAAQQAPGGEGSPAQRAVAHDRLPRRRSRKAHSGSERASGARTAAVTADNREKEPFHVERSASHSSRMLAHRAVLTLTLDQSCKLGPCDHHIVVSGGSSGPAAQKASRRTRLTRLRWTAPPTLRPTETPSRGPSSPSLLGAREAVEDQVAVGARGALPVDTLKVAASREPAALAPTGVGPRHVQGVRRLRPLRRRRRRTARPPRVRIRARKPWVLARLRFLGW